MRFSEKVRNEKKFEASHLKTEQNRKFL